MKTIQQIINDTLRADSNHDERYLQGRFHGFYREGRFFGLHCDQLLTCEDFPEAAGCCDSCHTFYAVYEMDLVETLRGWAWLCCGVRSKLFPRDYNKEPLSPEEKLLRAIFGEELPITAAPAPGTKMAPEPFVVTDENVEQFEERFKAMSQNNPDFKRLGDALHRYMIG